MSHLPKLAALGAVFLTLLSIYPGVLPEFLFIAFLFFPLWLPAVIIGGLSLLFQQARLGEEKAREPDPIPDHENTEVVKPSRSKQRRNHGASFIVIVSVALILTAVPRRIAFLCSRSAFQRLAATAPASEFEGEALGRFLGVFYVDRYAADPRGGIYFRTHTMADGIGPDRISLGFAFRPNSEGTPFGRAGYCVSQLVGNWYVFSASNDY